MQAPPPPPRDRDGDPVIPVSLIQHWYTVGLIDLPRLEQLMAKAVVREEDAQKWRDRHKTVWK